MNWEAIGAIGEIVGAGGVVLTLVYLANPIRWVIEMVDSMLIKRLLLLLALSIATNVYAADADTVQSALDAQSERLNAMISADIPALRDHLAEELSYSHANGRAETKSQFLSTIESKAVDYVSATPRDLEVRIYNETAIITGLSDLQLVVRGEPMSFTIRFLEVSRRTQDKWRLVAYQSVKFSAE